MRILFLTQYFPPEAGAPQNRISDLAMRLSAAGHCVTVLTAFPNYPQGRVAAPYRRKLRMTDRWKGLRVVRTWIYATPNQGFVSRLCNYFSFVISSVIFGARAAGQQDVVVVESPPLFLGLSGLLISRLKQARLLLNVSDLWPESAVALKVIRSHLLIRLSTWLEEFLYKKADAVTGQTAGIVASIRDRVPDKPAHLVTNGVAIEKFTPEVLSTSRDNIRPKLHLKREVIVGYAGLHGLAQGLDAVVEAARLLASHRDVVFLLIGEGAAKSQLQAKVAELGLKNVIFYPGQPQEKMAGIICSFDMALVPLKRLSLFRGALPSKMFEAMAAAVPLVVAIDGEARSLVEVAQAGVYVEPENPRALADAILGLSRDSARRRELGQNGRRFVITHFNRGAIAEKFEKILLGLCPSPAPAARRVMDTVR